MKSGSGRTEPDFLENPGPAGFPAGFFTRGLHRMVFALVLCSKGMGKCGQPTDKPRAECAGPHNAATHIIAVISFGRVIKFSRLLKLMSHGSRG